MNKIPIQSSKMSLQTIPTYLNLSLSREKLNIFFFKEKSLEYIAQQ